VLPTIKIEIPPLTVEGEPENGSPGNHELQLICALAYWRHCRSIFEFGTFRGRTVSHLARHVEQARIYTLDLPAGVTHGLFSRPGDDYFSLLRQDSLFVSGHPRITVLYGDSATFDFHPYLGLMDFVWVDAAHSYAACLADSLRALTLLAPGGMIAWHDYANSTEREVSEALEDLQRHSSLFAGLRHVVGTTVVFLNTAPRVTGYDEY
jgi:predicted O-methyltransferase YrrM